MTLHLLPVRTAGAAENMAVDFLLLQRYPEPTAARFRHYEWRRPAATFGYSQKIEFVRANLPCEASAKQGPAVPVTLDLCRRVTGGGIVDHRSDWTYALVIPRGHPLEEQPAPLSYRRIHEALAATLVALGQPAEVKMECAPVERVDPDALSGKASCLPGDGPDKHRAGISQQRCPAAPPLGPGVCFQRAELYDVIHPTTGAKIAGAAQKRNKRGLLFQGSIEKSAVGAIDWDAFHTHFATTLAATLEIAPQETSWPDFNEDEVTGLIEQYSSPEWIEYR